MIGFGIDRGLIFVMLRSFIVSSMDLHQVEDLAGQLSERMQREGFEIADQSLGIIPGTGWKDGVDQVIEAPHELDYSRLNIPGLGGNVEGHAQTLTRGTIEDRPVLRIGRVHANETTDPDVRLGTRVVIQAVKDRLRGLLVTQGVGSLTGPIEPEKGWLQAVIRGAIIDTMGWAIRGHFQTQVHPGDLVVVDSFQTLFVGGSTPLLSGEFPDVHHDGLHGFENRYFNLARQAIATVQGHAPAVRYGFLHGPQFEDKRDKLALRALGCETVGMSGLETFTAGKLHLPVAQVLLCTNNAFDPHSHTGNQDMGKRAAENTAKVIRYLSANWPDRSA